MKKSSFIEPVTYFRLNSLILLRGPLMSIFCMVTDSLESGKVTQIPAGSDLAIFREAFVTVYVVSMALSA